MEDPHVVALHYRVDVAEGYSYQNPPAVYVATAEFEGTLQSGKFVARMLKHYPVAVDARAPVEAYLRAWEISVGIHHTRVVLLFKFDHPDIVSRAPLNHGRPRVHEAVMLEALTASDTTTCHLTMGAYPQPPGNFVVTPLVETLWHRYESYTRGREPLYGMAYFCLTAIGAGSRGKKRQVAAAKYNIDIEVLNLLGDLSSERGGLVDARKVTDKLQLATASDIKWLETIIRNVIGQVGKAESGVLPATLTILNPPLV